MSKFIANMIKKQADVSLEKGQAKYKAYFVDTTIYAKYKDDVDAILDIDGYATCIV